MNKIYFMGTLMDSATMQETVALIADRIKQQLFTQHVVVNVAKLVNMRKDPDLARSVTECDIINIDGMGVLWGAKLLGLDVTERVAGVDLFHELIAMSEREQFPVFLLGAEQDVVKKTGDVVVAQHPDLKLVGSHHGYFWDDEKAIVDQIKASGARLLFVAITSPKKENFINKWKDELGVDFVMGVGGAFDVVAGKVNRAPVWMQNAGLEWLYRVIQEPRRMWKRYLLTNSQFVWLLIQAKLGLLQDENHNKV